VLSAKQPRTLAALLDYPPAGALRQAWVDHKLNMPDNVLNSAPGRVWQAWLDNSGSAANWIGMDTEACTASAEPASLRPGIWLTEACYAAEIKQLSAKKSLTIGERVKRTEAEFRLGDHGEALRQAEDIRAADPGNEWGVYWFSRAHAAVSEDCFLKIAALNPESPRVHQMLAEHYAAASDFAKATAEYNAAIRSSPELPDLHLGLGTVLWKAGKLQEARKELEATLAVVPGSPAGHYELGDILVQQRDWERAVSHLHQVPQNSAFATDAGLDLAKAEAELGKTQQAIDDLVKLEPQDEDGQIHFLLAGFYSRIGDTPHAQAALSTFKRLRSGLDQGSQDQFDALEKEHESRVSKIGSLSHP
jgi:tetratricopeptide (TPR) repeat protein